MSYKRYVSEADLIPLQEKTKNLQEGGYGYDNSFVLEWDGIIGDKYTIQVGDTGSSLLYYVKISDEYIERNTISKIEVYPQATGNIPDLKDWALETVEDGYFLNYNNAFAFGSVKKEITYNGFTVPKGTYVLTYTDKENNNTGFMYISSIYVSNIHTIDPKYLSIEIIDLQDYPVSSIGNTLAEVLAIGALSSYTPILAFNDVKSFVESLNPNKLYRFKISTQLAPGVNLLCDVRSMGVGDDGIVGAVTFGGAATFGNVYADITFTLQLNAEPYLVIDVLPTNIAANLDSLNDKINVEIPDTYATKDELNTLASQISSLNTALENTLEGADS